MTHSVPKGRVLFKHVVSYYSDTQLNFASVYSDVTVNGPSHPPESHKRMHYWNECSVQRVNNCASVAGMSAIWVLIFLTQVFWGP